MTRSRPEIDPEELQARGLAALARARNDHWVAGHLGATLLAGAWLLRDGHLSEPSALRLYERLQTEIARDPERYALPEVSTQKGETDLVFDDLERHVGDLWNGAHGTIYAALALRAFDEQPGLATPAHVEAIRRVHRNSLLPDLDRYFGIKNHTRIELEEVAFPADTAEFILPAFRELAVLHPDVTVDNRRYFFTSEKLHSITHTHALLLLRGLGRPDLAERGARARNRQIALARHTLPGENAPEPRSHSGPTDVDYWGPGMDAWHDVKFAHAISELLPHLSEVQRREVAPPLANAWAALA